MPVRQFLAISLCALAIINVLRAQLQDRATTDPVRVTLSVNPDGSRTAYEFDPSNHKAIATTTTADGRPQGKIRYELDDAGRFASGEVFAGDGRLCDQVALDKAQNNSRPKKPIAGNNSVPTLTLARQILASIVYAFTLLMAKDVA